MTSNIKIKKINTEISSIIIDEQKTYNSLSFQNLNDLLKAFKKLDADKRIKVIILEGAGKGFSAGHNLKEVRGLKKKDKYQKLFNLCSKVMLQIVEGRKPVIAKVHGAAFAAGCQLVASCDLAIASESARFITPGVNIGLFCSTPMVALSRNISNKAAMEMLLTGEMVSAKKAEHIGLINQAVKDIDLTESTMNMAKVIASKSSMTLKTGKQAFYKQKEMSLEAAYDYTSSIMVENMLKLDAQEGIGAFIEKRQPKWQDK